MLFGALQKLTDWISLYQVQVSGGCHKNRSLVQGYNILYTLAYTIPAVCHVIGSLSRDSLGYVRLVSYQHYAWLWDNREWRDWNAVGGGGGVVPVVRSEYAEAC